MNQEMAQIVSHGDYLGIPLREVQLRNGSLSLSLLNIGVATRDLRWIEGGANRALVLGYEDPRSYFDNPAYVGAIAGRVAGRIKGAGFSLDGIHHELIANEGENQLHGGPNSLAHMPWRVDLKGEQAALFTLTMPHGHNGFPGEVQFAVEVSLSSTSVTYTMSAIVDRPTPISLAQHSYYNLDGGRVPIWDHRLCADVTGYLTLDETNVPNGEVALLDGKPFDLRGDVALGVLDPQRHGSDINLVFAEGRDPRLPVARLLATDGFTMAVTSDQPGAQVYTATALDAHDGALPGQKIGPFQGLCFEPQGFPNAVNQSHFPSVIATPEEPYQQVLKLEFGWF